jgi:hypothetical protein
LAAELDLDLEPEAAPAPSSKALRVSNKEAPSAFNLASRAASAAATFPSVLDDDKSAIF